MGFYDIIEVLRTGINTIIIPSTVAFTGAQMPKESKNEIISIVKERFPKIQVLQADIKNNSIIINKR